RFFRLFLYPLGLWQSRAATRATAAVWLRIHAPELTRALLAAKTHAASCALAALPARSVCRSDIRHKTSSALACIGSIARERKGYGTRTKNSTREPLCYGGVRDHQCVLDLASVLHALRHVDGTAITS